MLYVSPLECCPKISNSTNLCAAFDRSGEQHSITCTLPGWISRNLWTSLNAGDVAASVFYYHFLVLTILAKVRYRWKSAATHKSTTHRLGPRRFLERTFDKRSWHYQVKEGTRQPIVFTKCLFCVFPCMEDGPLYMGIPKEGYFEDSLEGFSPMYLISAPSNLESLVILLRK